DEAAKAEKRSKDVARLQELEKARNDYAAFSLAEKSVVDSWDAQIAAQRAKILTIPDQPLSLDTPFRRVAMKPDESPYSFLAKLAKQRNFVLGETRRGELLIWRSIAPGEPRARFVEGQPPLLSVSASFDPQNYASEVTGVA